MNNNKRPVMGKWKRTLIAAALTVSVILALPVWNVGHAEATSGEPGKFNLSAGSCTLTVKRGDTTQSGDLVVDLYKVAKADDTETKGYEAYHLKAEEPYKTIQGTLDGIKNGTIEASKNEEKGTNRTYRELAQTVANIVLDLEDKKDEAGETIRDEAGDPIKVLVNDTLLDKEKMRKKISGNGSVTFENLDPGMYLVVAHGDMEPGQYIRKMDATVGDKLAPDYYKEGGSQYVTVATSGGYVYSYLPELIALPMRAPTGSDGTGTAESGSFNTSGSNPWHSSVTATLKSEAEHQMASLRIDKTFIDYEDALITEGDGCVYRIIATMPGQTEPVYRNVVSIDFTGKESGFYPLENVIPVGATVTVEEVSRGAGFDIVGDTVKTAVPNEAGTEYTVKFENIYNGKTTGGGIVVNHFEYGENGWTWTKIPETTVEQ